MSTRLLLIAASTLAIAACGSSETDVAENEDVINAPVVAEAEVGEGREDLDALPDETADFDNTDDDMAFASADEDLTTATDRLVAESERIADDAEDEMDTATDSLDAQSERAEMAAADTANDAESDMQDAATPVSDDTAAEQYTANNTDAYVAEDGELITGSEALALAGTYDVTIDGMDDSNTLYIQGSGNQAVGTFGGEPIEVAVTGRNFSFDAPVMMDGEEQLMTFAGTFTDSGIDNGVVSAEGDGAAKTFSAERTGSDETDASDADDSDAMNDDPNMDL